MLYTFNINKSLAKLIRYEKFITVMVVFRLDLQDETRLQDLAKDRVNGISNPHTLPVFLRSIDRCASSHRLWPARCRLDYLSSASAQFRSPLLGMSYSEAFLNELLTVGAGHGRIAAID